MSLSVQMRLTRERGGIARHVGLAGGRATLEQNNEALIGFPSIAPASGPLCWHLRCEEGNLGAALSRGAALLFLERPHADDVRRWDDDFHSVRCSTDVGRGAAGRLVPNPTVSGLDVRRQSAARRHGWLGHATSAFLEQCR